MGIIVLKPEGSILLSIQLSIVINLLIKSNHFNQRASELRNNLATLYFLKYGGGCRMNVWITEKNVLQLFVNREKYDS
jgi:hypothetical protein